MLWSCDKQVCYLGLSEAARSIVMYGRSRNPTRVFVSTILCLLTCLFITCGLLRCSRSSGRMPRPALRVARRADKPLCVLSQVVLDSIATAGFGDARVTGKSSWEARCLLCTGPQAFQERLVQTAICTSVPACKAHQKKQHPRFAPHPLGTAAAWADEHAILPPLTGVPQRTVWQSCATTVSPKLPRPWSAVFCGQCLILSPNHRLPSTTCMSRVPPI